MSHLTLNFFFFQPNFLTLLTFLHCGQAGRFCCIKSFLLFSKECCTLRSRRISRLAGGAGVHSGGAEVHSGGAVVHSGGAGVHSGGAECT